MVESTGRGQHFTIPDLFLLNFKSQVASYISFNLRCNQNISRFDTFFLIIQKIDSNFAEIDFQSLSYEGFTTIVYTMKCRRGYLK